MTAPAGSPVHKNRTGISISINDQRCVVKPDETKPDETKPVRYRNGGGVIVYRRNKRLKTGSSDDKVVINDDTKGIQVKEESTVKLNVEPMEVLLNENLNLEALDEKLITCSNSNVKPMQMLLNEHLKAIDEKLIICSDPASSTLSISDEKNSEALDGKLITSSNGAFPVLSTSNENLEAVDEKLITSSNGALSVLSTSSEDLEALDEKLITCSNPASSILSISNENLEALDEKLITSSNGALSVLSTSSEDLEALDEKLITCSDPGSSKLSISNESLEALDEKLITCSDHTLSVLSTSNESLEALDEKLITCSDRALSVLSIPDEVLKALDEKVITRSNGDESILRTATEQQPEMELSKKILNENLGALDKKLITSNGELSVLSSPIEQPEMEISKKISVVGRPTTVRELLETGLLEGYPVFYNGGKRGIPLRGTIKDTGILCSCNLCKGARVVLPGKFEIHACKAYKRASEYICLENGKSLLDVVKECRKGSLKKLEATIRSFIGPLPVKENIICQNCNSSFAATSVGKIDQICDSCIISLSSEATPTQSIKVEPGTFKPVRSINSLESSTASDTSLKRSRGRKQKKAVEIYSRKKSARISSSHIISGRKDQLKTPNRLSNTVLSPHSNGDATMCNSSRDKMQSEISKKLSKSIASSNSSKAGSLGISIHSRTQWKITKKDQKMHWLVFEEGGLPDGTEVAYYSRGKKLLVGYKQGSGIFCSCCNSEVSPSQFEAHAGWASRKKPYGYIYTSNGVSLHEFAMSLLRGRKSSVKDSDDLCIICSDGGVLVLCDGCPRAFHKECASLSAVPRGKWYCKYCENKFQREKFVEHNANAVAAGRVAGIDPIEQITNRCIRIVKNPEDAEVIACVLCRCYDFSKSGFGPRTVILCDQCEKEYHVGCLKKRKIADLKELPKGKWFCSVDCKRIYSALQNSLTSGEEKLSQSCLGAVRMKLKQKRMDFVGDLDVRWRLLSGKITSRETRVLLAEAVSIFHDCFDPIVDLATGRDFIPSMVYGRNIRGQDFGGMYCAILTVNSIVVSAGILRIFGPDMAELPLVATRIDSQGQGYFRLLLSCIEKLLAFLNIRRFVLPAAGEATSIWTEKFGFKEIPPDLLVSYKKTCWQLITFKGTSMLDKMVPKCRIVRHEETETDAPDE
ncbi:hypothetical protein CQW23_21373 [Capsicum baccatum]|uniref:PHD-type domain-containing protein n=1 Tax=Capsicum baccatum TaxID=33114 RepID=A0A2G2VXU4_CAPBA|nr:hypothetical protein CQW23_21373 [Capsicum baccatum]